MKLKHFAGYGTVKATRVKDKNHTLHIRVQGNHEWGLVRKDEGDLFMWLVRRFDKRVNNLIAWYKMRPRISYQHGYDNEAEEETCDYVFDYDVPEPAV